MAEVNSVKMASISSGKMAESSETELTMCDVLEEERELEEDAKAVLGDSDDTNCTYDRGYVPRQALYACATCTSSSDPGGICLACSYACHENHELVELYTKRNFRCDCGNKKFKNNSCRLCPHKDDFNSENAYNQNFRGLYCSCSRPYPDASDSVADEMIQCIICEDWYHGRHLGNHLPDNEDYGEMICEKCIQLHKFLSVYKAYFDSQKITVDKMKIEDPASTSGIANHQKLLCENIAAVCKTEVETCGKPEMNLSNKNNIEVEANSSNVGTKEKEACVLLKLQCTITNVGPAFLPEGWRRNLCHCDKCIELYREELCSFLLDEHDTIKAYEERGKSRNGEESQYDKGLSALSQLDRVNQIEAIHEYNNMKVQLKDYLKTFADSKRTVSAKDIQDFFDGMQKQKRQRVESHIPHFCR